MDMVATSWRLTPPSLPLLSPKVKSFRVYSSSSSSSLSLSPIIQKTSSLIQNSGVIACLRANSAELAYEAATAALNGGISVAARRNLYEYYKSVIFAGIVKLTIYGLELVWSVQYLVCFNKKPDLDQAPGAGFFGSPYELGQLEIVMSTPGVFQVLRQLVKDYPTLALGVIVLLLPLRFHDYLFSF
ncbi:hypothetical protein NC651_000427 [Populus alba x Populus x berolinensis]|nr:hypothetical protein NC651_000427 [Populus alba x Populus x berolinensis]